MFVSRQFYLALVTAVPLACRAQGLVGSSLLDQSFFTDYSHRIVTIATQPETVRIAYVDAAPANNATSKGTILIIHGWPSSSYGFHKVIPLLTQAGYRVIAPDYRGAGNSNKPLRLEGYRKSVMAADLHTLVQDHLNISESINVVGHDIGAMVAVAYASNFPDDTASLVWSEVPIPGSTFFEQTQNSRALWHFNFHRVPDLVELLSKGRVREYMKIFYDGFIVNPAGINPAEREYLASQYEEPGGMRAAANLYRTFDDDARENQVLLKQNGRVRVRSLSLFGDGTAVAAGAGEQTGEEFFEDSEAGIISDSGHWVAEENPADFAAKVLGFVGRGSEDMSE